MVVVAPAGDSGSVSGYDKQAAADARACRPKAPKLVVDVVLAEAVLERLAQRWSPAAIAADLRIWGQRVCAETIYRACYVHLAVIQDNLNTMPRKLHNWQNAQAIHNHHNCNHRQSLPADPGTMASTVTQSVSVIQAMSVTLADTDPTENSDAALLAAKMQGRTRVAALLDDAVRHVAEVERHNRLRFHNEAADQAATTQASLGIKVAGGVRSAEEALKYLAIIRSVLGEDWLTPDLCRFGASSLLNNVVAELSTTPS